MTTGSPGRTGTRRPGHTVLGLGIAVALIALYLGVAAGHARGPIDRDAGPAELGHPARSGGKPRRIARRERGTTPDAAPDPDTDVAPLNATLQDLIPSDVQSGNTCSDNGASLGAIAEITCTSVQGLAAETFYYLFADTDAMNQGNNTLLANGSFQTSCTGGDGNFDEFTASYQSPLHDCFNGNLRHRFGISRQRQQSGYRHYRRSAETPVRDGRVRRRRLLNYWRSMRWIVTST